MPGCSGLARRRAPATGAKAEWSGVPGQDDRQIDAAGHPAHPEISAERRAARNRLPRRRFGRVYTDADVRAHERLSGPATRRIWSGGRHERRRGTQECDRRSACATSLADYAGQPGVGDWFGLGRKPVPAVEHVELHVGGTQAQPLRVELGDVRLIEFVFAARDVQNGRGDRTDRDPLPNFAECRRRCRSRRGFLRDAWPRTGSSCPPAARSRPESGGRRECHTRVRPRSGRAAACRDAGARTNPGACAWPIRSPPPWDACER